MESQNEKMSEQSLAFINDSKDLMRNFFICIVLSFVGQQLC